MAGTITITHAQNGNIGLIVASCTADASDASFPDSALPPFAGRLLTLQTNPGSTGPQASYDITLVDQDGIDRIQGVGANRHTSNSEAASIVYSGTAVNPPVAFGDTLTLNIDNNNVNSATVVIRLYYLAG